LSPLFLQIVNKNNKNKNMREKKCSCPECAKREKEFKESEELNLAILISLMPLLVVTLFSNMGLF
jgi:hypothetical protein